MNNLCFIPVTISKKYNSGTYIKKGKPSSRFPSGEASASTGINQLFFVTHLLSGAARERFLSCCLSLRLSCLISSLSLASPSSEQVKIAHYRQIIEVWINYAIDIGIVIQFSIILQKSSDPWHYLKCYTLNKLHTWTPQLSYAPNKWLFLVSQSKHPNNYVLPSFKSLE